MIGARLEERIRCAAPILAAVLVLLSVSAALAADERHLDEEGNVRLDSVWVELLSGDSLWADSSNVDSLIHIDSLQYEERKLAPVLAKVDPGFHPQYRGSWEKIRSNTRWNHRFGLAYRLADNIVVSDTTVFESQESSITSRSRSSRTDGGGVDYLFKRGVKLSLRFKQQVDSDKPAGEKKDIQDRRLSLGGSIRREFDEDTEFTINGAVILNRRDKRDEKSLGEGGNSIKDNVRTGLSRRMLVNLRRKLGKGFKVAVDGSLVSGTTRIETSGNNIETVVQDDNRNDSRNAGFSLSHNDFALGKVNIKVSTEETVRSFAALNGEVEETTDKRFRVNFRLQGDVTERLKYESSVNYADASRRYKLDNAKSNDALNLDGDILLRYKLPSRIQSQLKMQRSSNEDTYFPDPGDPDRTGKTDRGEVALNLSRSFWKSTKMTASSAILLTRKALVDSTQDKDDQTKRLTFSLDHKPANAKFEAGATMNVNEAKSVNIAASRSSSNQTRQTWALTPTFTYNPRSGISINNNYNLRLVYTFNDRNPDLNTMNRILELRSLFRWAFLSQGAFRVSYRFKVDENGGFTGSGAVREFFRTGETSVQKLSLAIRFGLFGGVVVRSGQSFEATRRYDIGQEKVLQSSANRVQIENQVDWEKILPWDSKFEFYARQIQNVQESTFKLSGSAGNAKRKTEWEIRTSFVLQL